MPENYKAIFQNPSSEIDHWDAISRFSYLHAASGLQDSAQYRALAWARYLATQLISSSGEGVIYTREMTNQYFSNGLADGVRVSHQKKFIELWNRGLYKAILRFRSSILSPIGAQLIRDTLLLPVSEKINDTHLRQAVVCVCMTPLRQKIGSCFATAPAILIQAEQVEVFFDDLYALLSTGYLRRIVDEQEVVVRLSTHFGRAMLHQPLMKEGASPWLNPSLIEILSSMKVLTAKDNWRANAKQLFSLMQPFLALTVEQLLEAIVPRAQQLLAKRLFVTHTENALLHCWEYTIASFADRQSGITCWNLYHALGFDSQVAGGIGAAIYSKAQELLQEAQLELQKWHNETASAHDQCRLAKRLLEAAESESAARRLRAEYQARYHHLVSCTELCEQKQKIIEFLLNSFKWLMERFYQLMSEFFQEMYDPDLVQPLKSTFGDAPAGFCLVYTYGRRDPLNWEVVDNSKTLMQVLADFFALAEQRLLYERQNKEELAILNILMSTAMLHVRSSAFEEFILSNAKERGKLPWSYISGGSLDNIIKNYFEVRGELTCESRQVQSELELCVFILDTLKALPPKITDRFIINPDSSLLMRSPTHAFLLKPGWDFLRAAWETTGFSYTWIRDEFLVPMQRFYIEMTLSVEQQKTILQRFYPAILPTNRELTVAAFYQYLIDLSLTDVEAVLYRALPVYSRQQCQAVLQNGEVTVTALPDFLVACDFYETAAVLVGHREHIVHRMRQLGLAPKPLLFADSNWATYFLAFSVNPGTQELQLWRMDPTGTTGFPMQEWKRHFNALEKTPWVIYTDPYQYIKLEKGVIVKT